MGPTACGRSDAEAPGALDKRPAREWEAVDCPTCKPIAHERARLEALDAERPEWLRELRRLKDAGPFMPVLCAELEGRGIRADWSPDVMTRRGFYVVAMRRGSVTATTAWVRFRGFAERDDRDTLLQVARMQPLEDSVPVTTVSANPSFIAAALSGSTLADLKAGVLSEFSRREALERAGERG